MQHFDDQEGRRADLRAAQAAAERAAKSTEQLEIERRFLQATLLDGLTRELAMLVTKATGQQQYPLGQDPLQVGTSMDTDLQILVATLAEQAAALNTIAQARLAELGYTL